MRATIVDRGRGPEITGTRVTVSRVMDYLRDKAAPARIAEELRLTSDEVEVALAYIDANRAAVEAAFEALLKHRSEQRTQGAVLPTTPEELKQRIASR